MKPKGGKCTSRWSLGRVTGVTSSNNVDVDGVPRHILDIRKLYDTGGCDDCPKVNEKNDVRVIEFESDSLDEDDPQDEQDDADSDEISSGRPLYHRRPPSLLADHE